MKEIQMMSMAQQLIYEDMDQMKAATFGKGKKTRK